jgi:L-asparaginase
MDGTRRRPAQPVRYSSRVDPSAFRRLRSAVAAGLFLLAALPSVGQDAPRVHLIATGGTISNRPGGRLSHEELLESIPNVDRYASVEGEQFSNVPSDSLTLDQWLQLARRINERFARDRGLAGIVVTSGTDTLEEVAYFLNLTVRDERPVVVAGAMRYPGAIGSDGAANLLAALRVAAEPAARGKGVLVVLNDEINAARDVTKTDALRLHTFQTRGYGLLGVVDPDDVVFYRDVVKRHTAHSEFDVSSVTSLPRVDVIMVYQGASGDLIRSAADLGARGLVIASAGAGATSGTQQDGIRYATDKGVMVVTSTRTGGGRIPASRAGRGLWPDGGSPSQRRLVLGAEDLAPVKARILLMLALTKTQDPVDIQRMFTEY